MATRTLIMDTLKKYRWLAACLLVALVLLPAGGAKLAGVPAMHASFAALGLPGWFGYFIGACEVAGGVALFVAPLRSLAAAGISIIMLGALYFHLSHPPVSAGVPALIVLVLCGVIIQRRGAALVAA
jgi:uncharacterized membrane protein YphA (DoxX/SURF4 family)